MSAEREVCERCGPLIEALSATDHQATIIAEPTKDGTILVFRGADGHVRYVRLSPGVAAWMQSAGVPLRNAHLPAICARRGLKS